jgi:hypothetical protein
MEWKIVVLIDAAEKNYDSDLPCKNIIAWDHRSEKITFVPEFLEIGIFAKTSDLPSKTIIASITVLRK